MQRAWTYVAISSVLAVMLVATGCGSGEDSPDPDPSEAGAGAENEGSGSPSVDASPTPVVPTNTEPVNPTVVIKASIAGVAAGNITIELDQENSPLTVNNFLEYVESGFYDRTIFHQVFPKAVILGGMFQADGSAKETRGSIRNEALNGLTNDRGTVAMARQWDVPDSATCQFFINVQDNPNYNHKPQSVDGYDMPEDYGYCVFGRVIDGMMVVDQIADVQVHDTVDFERKPVEVVLIDSIQRIR